MISAISVKIAKIVKFILPMSHFEIYVRNWNWSRVCLLQQFTLKFYNIALANIPGMPRTTVKNIPLDNNVRDMKVEDKVLNITTLKTD